MLRCFFSLVSIKNNEFEEGNSGKENRMQESFVRSQREKFICGKLTNRGVNECGKRNETCIINNN